MKNIAKIIAMAIVLLLSACQKEELIVSEAKNRSIFNSDTKLKFDINSSSFDSKTVSTDNLSIGKIFHSAVVHQDKMWTIEGIGDGLTNNIASSIDGLKWEKIKIKTGFLPLWGQASAVFQDKIWALNGLHYQPLPTNTSCSSVSLSNIWYMEP